MAQKILTRTTIGAADNEPKYHPIASPHWTTPTIYCTTMGGGKKEYKTIFDCDFAPWWDPLEGIKLEEGTIDLSKFEPILAETGYEDSRYLTSNVVVVPEAILYNPQYNPKWITIKETEYGIQKLQRNTQKITAEDANIDKIDNKSQAPHYDNQEEIIRRMRERKQLEKNNKQNEGPSMGL